MQSGSEGENRKKASTETAWVKDTKWVSHVGDRDLVRVAEATMWPGSRDVQAKQEELSEEEAREKRTKENRHHDHVPFDDLPTTVALGSTHPQKVYRGSPATKLHSLELVDIHRRKSPKRLMRDGSMRCLRVEVIE